MKKYVVDLRSTDKDNTAQYKAKNDITDILSKKGYKVIPYYFSKFKMIKLFRVLYTVFRFKFINKGIVVYQYPLGTKKVDTIFIHELKKNKSIKKISVIHDLESLRFNKNNSESLKKEIQLLNAFDGIVVHNDSMQQWLKKNGLKAPMSNIRVFDYLLDSKTINRDLKQKNNNIIFAGNLKKAGFLKKLNLKTSIDVFGPNPELNEYPHNIRYKGVVSSDVLVSKINEKFGLIWDGNSVSECTGMYGNYEKFNTPHKLSLYLSSDTPVIAWKQAAISKFIEDNHVGITVTSLEELDKILSNISDKDYNQLFNNTRIVGRKIRNGDYICKAINELLQD